MIRKRWGGNATWIGAGTQERLMSVCRTARQQGVDAIEALTELQTSATAVVRRGTLAATPGRDGPGVLC